MVCERCGTVFCWDEADEGTLAGKRRRYCGRTCMLKTLPRYKKSKRNWIRAHNRQRQGQPRTYDGISDEAIYHRDDWTCQMPECLCPSGRRIDPGLRHPESVWAASIDHIVRLADGGSDSADNKRAAHAKCNQHGDPFRRLPSAQEQVAES